MKLEPGDYVTLRTGGPLMNIEIIRVAKDITLAHTVWVDRGGTPSGTASTSSHSSNGSPSTMTDSGQLTFNTMGGNTVIVKKRGKHYVEPRGYAAPPGTGPAGETCGSCKHIHRNQQAKVYLKCDAVVQDDGFANLELKVTKLTLEEAQALADGIKDHFRTVLTKILSKDGTQEIHHRDMLRQPQ